MPVADYEPRLIEVLKDGGQTPRTLRFPDLQIAQTFRQRLYRLRKAMWKEANSPPPGWNQTSWTKAIENANRTQMRIIYRFADGREQPYFNKKTTPMPDAKILMPWNLEKNLAPIELIIEPKDSPFEAILSASGYKVPELDL